MSLFLYKEKLGFCSDTYLPLGPKSRFLLFIFSDVIPKLNLDDNNVKHVQKISFLTLFGCGVKIRLDINPYKYG